VKANYLPTAISGAVRSWLINLPKGTIYNWDKFYAMFIGNFQGTYEWASTTKTLKTIKEKHDERLWDYVKHFYNVMNPIPNIHDTEIMNSFRDGVTYIKTIEEITIKKLKTVVGLLVVANECRGL
jgi:hypothetical protein